MLFITKLKLGTVIDYNIRHRIRVRLLTAADFLGLKAWNELGLRRVSTSNGALNLSSLLLGDGVGTELLGRLEVIEEKVAAGEKEERHL